LTSDEIILGRVTFYHIDIGAYDVADGDDSKRYHLPENQVAPLDMLYSQRRLTKGEEVLAIYPETTSFYPAYIVQAPRRTAIGTIH
jgi:SGF29 tudor-like domain